MTLHGDMGLTVKYVLRFPYGKYSITRAGEKRPVSNNTVEPTLAEAIVYSTFTDDPIEPHNVVVGNLVHDVHFILKIFYHFLR